MPYVSNKLPFYLIVYLYEHAESRIQLFLVTGNVLRTLRMTVTLQYSSMVVYLVLHGLRMLIYNRIFSIRNHHGEVRLTLEQYSEQYNMD